MLSGSQSNQAPEPPGASPACPASRPGELSAACFHPSAAAKIPASRRFPARHQLPAHRGLSTPARSQNRLRAVRDRYLRRPVPLRARSGKPPVRRCAASGPPRTQSRDPTLPPHLLGVPGTRAKLLSPVQPRARRYATTSTSLPCRRSNFFLDHHDSRSCPFVRRKFGVDRKPARPYHDATTCEHWPAVPFPAADVLLVEQALQLMSAAVPLRTQSVSGAPIAQENRQSQLDAVQNNFIPTSFPPLGRPFNHPEAEYEPWFRTV